MSWLDRIADKVADLVVTKSDALVDLKNPGAAMLLGSAERYRLRQPYSQVPIVYAIINACASRLGRVPVKFYREGTDREVEQHPVIERLKHPCPNYSWNNWLTLLIIRKRITGERLVYKDPDEYQGVPIALWPYHRDMYKPVVRDGMWIGWELREDGKRPINVLNDEVIYDRYVHPSDPFRGLSPIEAGTVSLETELSARWYNKRFFDNDASPGNWYHFDKAPKERDREVLEHNIADRRQGVDRAHSTLVTWGGAAQHEHTGISQKDAQFIEQFGLTRHDLCSIYQTDPAIIGYENESKYASAKEARRYFWTDVVKPEGTVVQQMLTDGLTKEYGIEVRFDFSGVEALQANMKEQVEVARQLWEMGWTANQINDRLELGMEPAPNGDEPKPQSAPLMLDRDPDEQKDFIDPDLAIKELRGRKWKQAVEGVSRATSGMRSRLRAFFRDVEQRMLREFEKQNGPVATKDISADAVDDALNVPKLMDIFLEFIGAGATVGYTQVFGKLDDIPESVRSMIPRRGARVKEVAQHAREDIRLAVQEAVRQSVEDGLSEAQTTQAVKEALHGAIDKLDTRARTIARTEVHGAYSEARHQAAQDTGAIGRMWISSRDGEVRDSHAALDGVSVGPGEKYPNGLAYPLDGNGPAEEVINCRCIEIPIYEGQNPASMGGA